MIMVCEFDACGSVLFWDGRTILGCWRGTCSFCSSCALPFQSVDFGFGGSGEYGQVPARLGDPGYDTAELNEDDFVQHTSYLVLYL